VTGTSATALTVIEAFPVPQPAAAPAPRLKPDPTRARPAVRRCCAAWQRAFNAYMEDCEGTSTDRVFAANEADKTYCNAMPLLSSYESIRDFIACTAHGILIGAIPPQKSGHILYAAQVALTSLQCEPKPRNLACPPPPPGASFPSRSSCNPLRMNILWVPTIE